MTCAAQLFTALQALHTADSGATGLNNAASTAYLPGFYRRGDSGNRTTLPPTVEVSLSESPDHQFARDGFEVSGSFVVRSPSQPDFTPINAIMTRLWTVYHRVVPTAGSTWEWSNCFLTGEPTVVEDLRTSEHVGTQAFRVYAREV